MSGMRQVEPRTSSGESECESISRLRRRVLHLLEGMLGELRALLDVDVQVFRLGASVEC